MTNLSSVKQLFENIILTEELKGQNVEIINAWKTDWQNNFAGITTQLNNLHSVFATVLNTYNDTDEINDTNARLLAIQAKKTAIATSPYTCPVADGVGCGCDSAHYKILCDLLDDAYDTLDSDAVGGASGVNAQLADINQEPFPPGNVMSTINTLFTDINNNPLLS